MKPKTNVNHKLNFLKGIACMGVVFIHILFPGKFGLIVKAASAYAVPIFFMIAGYYAFGKGAEVIKRRLMKIVKIFLYAYILFFVYNFIFAIRGHQIAEWISTHYNWKTPIKYIWFCAIDFAIPLWYLIAMIEVYIVWYFIVKNRKEQVALKIVPILFLLQIMLSSYCDTMQFEWFWRTNFVTRAMPWFLVGYCMNTNKTEKIRSMVSSKLITMVVVGCVIVVLPTTFSLPFDFSVVGYIPYAFGLFALALKNPNNSVCKPIEYIGDKLSLNIYIFHTLISGVVDFIGKRLLQNNISENVWGWCQPIIVLICTIVASWIVCIILDYTTMYAKSKTSRIS